MGLSEFADDHGDCWARRVLWGIVGFRFDGVFVVFRRLGVSFL